MLREEPRREKFAKVRKSAYFIGSGCWKCIFSLGTPIHGRNLTKRIWDPPKSTLAVTMELEFPGSVRIMRAKLRKSTKKKIDIITQVRLRARSARKFFQGPQNPSKMDLEGWIWRLGSIGVDFEFVWARSRSGMVAILYRFRDFHEFRHFLAKGNAPKRVQKLHLHYK